LNDGCWVLFFFPLIHSGTDFCTEHICQHCVSLIPLAFGCRRSFRIYRTGIGPEAFAYISSDGNFTGGNGISASQLAFFNQHGYYITSSPYILRPEGLFASLNGSYFSQSASVLESNFMAWRVTGDTKYLDRAASAIDSFNKFLPATVAFASLNNVNSVNGGLIDDMESFWFAEVLKYLYVHRLPPCRFLPNPL
jgi:mannosyl-oligosaccharide alpha-1,2-mannosidase